MNSLGFCRAAIRSAALLVAGCAIAAFPEGGYHLLKRYDFGTARYGRFCSYTRADDGATETTALARFGNIPPSRLRAVTDLRLGGSNE